MVDAILTDRIGLVRCCCCCCYCYCCCGGGGGGGGGGKKQSKGTKHGAPVELCARREWAPMPLAMESDGGGGPAARVF